jgi:AcrR family transcriptional regulator
MASNLRARRREQLRIEILEAAHQIMASDGYAALSMEDLAARVGVSKPTLYNQFPAKQDLVAAMALQLLERVFAGVEHAEQIGLSPLERLLRFLHAIVQVQVLESTTAIQLWLPEIMRILESHPESSAYLCRVDQVVIDLIHQAITAGEIDPRVDVRSVVRVFYALIHTPNIGRLSAAGAPDPDELADTVVAVFRRGLAAPKPGTF